MQRDVALDGLRALAILYIVGFCHLIERSQVLLWYQQNAAIGTRLTIVVLGLFIFLSGYLVGTKERFDNLRDVGRYYGRRVLRIYPLYLLAIAMFWLMHLTSPASLIKAALLVSMFAKPAPPTLYFITILMGYYLVAPLLIRMKNDPGRYVFVCAMLMLGLLGYRHAAGFLDIRILLYLPSFAFGVWLGGRKLPESWIAVAAAVLAFLVSVWISLIETESPVLYHYLRMPLSMAGPLALLLLARKARGRGLWTKGAAFLSYCSFSMYLFHRPVYVLLRRHYFPKEASWQAAYLFLVCLPLAIAVAWGIQKAYDAGLRRSAQWRRDRPTDTRNRPGATAAS